MSKSLYESLLRGEPTLGAEGLLGAFASAAATVRHDKQTGLAQAEFEDGTWVDEDDQAWLDSDLDDLALAARDHAEREFPVRYRGGGRTVLLGLDEHGETYALLEVGPGPIGVLGVRLALGVEVRIGLDSPPTRLELDDGSVLEP